MKPLSPGTKTLIKSQSPKAPFLVVFEDDGEDAYFHAVTNSTTEDLDVEDSVHIYTVSDIEDERSAFRHLDIRWDDNGTQCALLINHLFFAVLNFDTTTTYTRSNKVPPSHGWKREELVWTDDLSTQFDLDPLLMFNKPLKAAAKTVFENDGESARLHLYKTLMRSALILPVNENHTEEDPQIFIFPDPAKQNEQDPGMCLFAFSDLEMFQQHMASFSLKHTRIEASKLFHHLQQQPIEKVILTTDHNISITIKAKEFPIIALDFDSDSQTPEQLLQKMSDLLIEPMELPDSHPLKHNLLELIQKTPNIAHAYLFRSTTHDANTILGLTLSEKDDVSLVKLYRDLGVTLKEFGQDADSIEITVLEPHTHLLAVVEQACPPIYSQK